ncbi:hypothetical protein C0995_007612 [Termitomyces sp. Mi166|nr:hypothetical protein C0995_007612 [Termitomyces sp. Mi166\
MASQDLSQDIFRRLKAICVPLLGASLLTSTSIPDVFKYLGELTKILLDVRASGFVLTPNLISYIFFPLSTLLRRNTASDIPDQILEKIFIALSVLCEDWWWDCDIAVWEQLFMLCGAVIAGIDEQGNGKSRDDETKEAAGGCLLALLRVRTHEATSNPTTVSDRTQARLEMLKTATRNDKFLPVLGQTLDSLLMTVDTPHLPLQRVSLSVLSLILGTYAPDSLVPSVLPGVVSRMTRTALGASTKRGWANGEIVSGSLEVMRFAIVRALGNDICAEEGAIRPVVDLEDLAHATVGRPDLPLPESRPFSTLRTPSWLRGTSSQLLIALNTLTPLVTHPTPLALLAVLKLSTTLLSATSMTLPEVQPLLLHWLLSLSNSDFSSVSIESRGSLSSLLMTPSDAQLPLQQTLLHILNDNLSALPRLLATRADAKVEHVAGIVEAVCRLVSSPEGPKEGVFFFSSGIGKLLGSSGGIDRWGWSLLSVLELSKPPITSTTASSARLMVESNTNMTQWEGFPDIDFKNVFSATTRKALGRMFRGLGRASGDNCLFSIEWFVNVGRSGLDSRSITAMWCACRLLEGVADVSLGQGSEIDGIPARRSRRLTRLIRSLVRNVAELWDEPVNNEPTEAMLREEEDVTPQILVQHAKGMNNLHENLRIARRAPVKQCMTTKQPELHESLLLQFLAISAGTLQAQFMPLLLYTLYPILRSLVSPDVCLSSTALATLNYIAIMTSYASPANLLLSNFDYTLDSISRRLSRRWLDIEATKVLSLMVRLVGSDIVQRAGDVVEECFDRLDEFHGYSIIVERLLDVLGDVVNVIKEDTRDNPSVSTDPPDDAEEMDITSMDDFFDWLSRGHRLPIKEVDTTDYGPNPKETWGASKIPEPDPADDTAAEQEPNPDADPPLTPIQALTKQIVSRSLYFLTHDSSVIRARILSLLASSVPVLSESALLPSIHYAWPFILNRLSDSEAFVVSSAASLVESLATHFGSFMFRRIWDDVWPRFRVLLNHLDAADATSALSRRGVGAVGTESAYTYSHRIYRSVIRTMTVAATAVHLQETSIWQLLLAFRRFLHREAHEELQQCARDLYLAVGKKEVDPVWLALSSTMDSTHMTMQFLAASQWDIRSNVKIIFQEL